MTLETYLGLRQGLDVPRPEHVPPPEAWRYGICASCGGSRSLRYYMWWNREKPQTAPCVDCGGTGNTHRVDPTLPLEWCPEGAQEYAVWLACVYVLPVWERWAADAIPQHNGNLVQIPRQVLASETVTGDEALFDRLASPVLPWPPTRAQDAVLAAQHYRESRIVEDPSMARLHALQAALRAALPTHEYSWEGEARFYSRWRAECEARLAFIAGAGVETWDRSTVELKPLVTDVRRR